jgi:putative endonuclease
MSRGRAPRKLGDTWESRAAEYLRGQGIRILAQGYCCRLGELDIVGSDGTGLVVVEVRARGSRSLGTALESISSHKRRRIVRATRHFLMRRPEWASRPIRFDVVAFDGIDSATPELNWVKNAFDSA